MKPFAPKNHHFENPETRSSGKLPLRRFLLRYPVFLLALGPPIFRPNAGIDATKGVIDFWAVLQVGWIGIIGLRAMMRLASAQTILIPKQTRSILRLFFILGLLFLASAEYSPSRSVSAAYAVLYFLTFFSVAEFVVDAYKYPPDWMQCLFHIRTIFSLLYLLVLFTIPFAQELVMNAEAGVGLRMGGGAVAPVNVICPIIAVISWYAFLFSLESKARSVFFFFVGVAGTLIAQSRGAELSLVSALMLTGFIWAKTGRRSSYLFIASSFASVLLGGAALAVVGGSRVWNFFNKGQSLESMGSISGRTDIWKFVFHYCMAHPLGMGYIAGFRKIFKEYFALGLQLEVSHIGNAHNSIMDVLADAGWPALAVFLYALIKIIALGWRYARRRAVFSTASDRLTNHALRCALVLLVLCLACGTEAADFSIPLRGAFYIQNISIAIILGITARSIAASRARSAPSFE